MKVSENQLTAFTGNDFTKLLDSYATGFERCTCPNCGRGINYRESHIDSTEHKLFQSYIKRFETMLKEIDSAVAEVYGEDPRKTLLVHKIKAIQSEFEQDCKPKLKIVRNEDKP
jgi:predicted nucleic-acid-binding Zn-ribbon protein